MGDPAERNAKLKETGKAHHRSHHQLAGLGYITEQNALPNMYVEPSTKLYTVADLSRVWVYAQVFQDDVGRVRPGDTAQITVDSYPGRIFSGQIEEILPQVDMATRTVRVRLAIANPGLKLKPGMFVNVDLKTSSGTSAHRACVGCLSIRHTATGIPQSRQRQSGAKRDHSWSPRWR